MSNQFTQVLLMVTCVLLGIGLGRAHSILLDAIREYWKVIQMEKEDKDNADLH